MQEARKRGKSGGWILGIKQSAKIVEIAPFNITIFLSSTLLPLHYLIPAWTALAALAEKAKKESEYKKTCQKASIGRYRRYLAESNGQRGPDC